MDAHSPPQRTLLSTARRGALFGGFTTLAVIGPFGISMLFCTSAKTKAAGIQDWNFDSALLQTVLITIVLTAIGSAFGAALCLLGGVLTPKRMRH